jgi:sugar transferase EpsL
MQRKNTFYQKYGKRLIDLSFALPALVVLLPALVSLAILVRAKLGSPALFQQVRPGLGGRPFTIFKFRTMTDARDAAGNLLPDAERLPGFGKFLRSVSLDELPELWNVVKGDMSLVGPRPLLMEYLSLYNDFQYRRHETRPGVTGWAQVMGRNALCWDEKFDLDIWYVDNSNFGLDIKILAMTVFKIFRREGINQPGQATAEKFKGECKGNPNQVKNNG